MARNTYLACILLSKHNLISKLTLTKIKVPFSLCCLFVSCMFIHMFKSLSVFFRTISHATFHFAGHLEKPSPDHVRFRVVPSGLGMHGPLAGSCVRCGCGAVCREGRAAADRTYNRTVVSPGHAPDRLEPEDKSQIKLKHILPQERKSRSLRGCVYIQGLPKEANSLSNSSQRVPKNMGIKQMKRCFLFIIFI